jgi:hypothetical protein
MTTSHHFDALMRSVGIQSNEAGGCILINVILVECTHIQRAGGRRSMTKAAKIAPEFDILPGATIPFLQRPNQPYLSSST